MLLIICSTIFQWPLKCNDSLPFLSELFQFFTKYIIKIYVMSNQFDLISVQKKKTLGHTC